MAVLLQFCTSWRDPISWAIRFSTRSWCSHVEFVLDDGSTLGAHAAGGVLHRPYAHNPRGHVERYTAPMIDAAYEVALTQVGKRYDFSAITGIALDRNWRDPSRWFCSELVAAAFESVDAPLLNPAAQVWRITPRDLLLSLAITPSEFPDLKGGAAVRGGSGAGALIGPSSGA